MARDPTAAEIWYLELAGRRLELQPGEVLVGRGGDCDVVLSDGTVSRHHAVLRVGEEGVVLRDLGSSNGTFANGLAVDGEVAVREGDRLRLGRVRLRLGRGLADAPGGRRFCRTCGHRVPPGVHTCPTCGEDLDREPPLSRSEAIALSEVMPVGEVLATPARRRTGSSYPLSWDDGEGGAGSPAGDDTADSPMPARPEGPQGEAEEAEEAERATVAEGATDPAEEPTAPTDRHRVGVEGEAAAVPGRPERRRGETPRSALADALRAAAREGRPLFLPAATFGPRLGAALLDALWVLAVGLLTTLAAGGPGEPPAPWLGAVAAAAAWFTVSLVGWSRWGTTPGKAPFRLYVCDLDGRPGVAPGRALARFLGCLLSLATLGVGFLRAALAADHRALHDHLAGTYVARLEDRRR